MEAEWKCLYFKEVERGKDESLGNPCFNRKKYRKVWDLFLQTVLFVRHQSMILAKYYKERCRDIYVAISLAYNHIMMSGDGAEFSVM